MKREILEVKRKKHINWCCPGHDIYPDEKYNNKRSAHARSRDKKLEHQHARSILNRELQQEIKKGT